MTFNYTPDIFQNTPYFSETRVLHSQGTTLSRSGPQLVAGCRQMIGRVRECHWAHESHIRAKDNKILRATSSGLCITYLTEARALYTAWLVAEMMVVAK